MISKSILKCKMPIALILLSLLAFSGCDNNSIEPESSNISARMLVQPDALSGGGPEIIGWSPEGSELLYMLNNGDTSLLKIYNPQSEEKSVLLNSSELGSGIITESVQWCSSGDMILFSDDSSSLRLLDRYTKEVKSLAGGAEERKSASFSPDGELVTYTAANDLFTIAIDDGRITRLTEDGSDSVFNGCLDWVYEEELAMRSEQPGYSWSPDGKWIVYMKLDNTDVNKVPIIDYSSTPPIVDYTRYPHTGSMNPKVSLHTISMQGNYAAREIQLPGETEYVLPSFSWTPDSREVFFLTVNRERTALKLNAWNPSANSSRTVIEEYRDDWISENFYSSPVFLEDAANTFLWLSERSGFMHIYHYSTEGDMLSQLTEGEWLINTIAYDLLEPSRPVHIDASGSFAYFTSTMNSPLERHIYKLNIESGNLEQISEESGFHLFSLSSDGEFMVTQFSNVETPTITSVIDTSTLKILPLGKCEGPLINLPKLKREFLTLNANDGTELYAQIVKPESFDPDRKYGAVVHWYGGPGLQLVSNRYGTTNIFNHIEKDIMYTQEDLIVWRLDNRGSLGRGHSFEAPIHGELGKVALEDQLAGIEYLKGLPYIDPDRIGSDGKSFGGFLTLYALIHAPDVLSCGIAGSGPTDWQYYDTIYTERYMGTPQSNPEGYSSTELIGKADQISAVPLIIHGLSDRNVHFQNSVNFIQALQKSDKRFEFLPLPNEDHHYEGDGLATVLSESACYFRRFIGSEMPLEANPER